MRLLTINPKLSSKNNFQTIQLIWMNYIPMHSWDHVDSECVSYVGYTISQPNLSVTNLLIHSLAQRCSTSYIRRDVTYRLCFMSNANDICISELVKMFIQLRYVTTELEVGIKHDNSIDGLRHYTMHGNWQKEQCIAIICSRLEAEMLLHRLNDEIKLFCQFGHIQHYKLQFQQE